MRVALVVERFEEHGGGGERVVWNVARERVRAGDDVHVLCRRGVDVERFAPERHRGDRAAIRAALNAGDATVWLFAGSGWRRKGLEIAIEALAGVADATSQPWVAGRDEPRRWRTLARRLGVEPRTRFLGECEDLERYYAAVHGLLLPTQYDAFGLVCLEAAAAGLPVVTSKNAGASELFESCGRVVHDCANPLAYARVMNHLARKEPRAELGAKALRMARQHDWGQHVARLRDRYLRVSRATGGEEEPAVKQR
jgi:UDP-glucose:(heptosyl)LPS alpha-1,3-glucosyltransferase